MKIRNPQGKITPLKLFTDDPFAQIYHLYAEKVAKCPRGALQLKFGGDLIKDSDTPESLHMDDDDFIDVKW